MRQISASLNTLSRSALSLFVTVLLLAGAAQAQTTAFTYQGRLGDTGMPATGSYDFQFKLFDTLTGGTQIGVIQSNGVAVTSGVFNVTLDYGASAFPGAARFLEISVRLAGGGAFTTLTPRRPLNSVPYAVQSLNAATATNATTATNFSGALAGDVTGTQAATVIANNAVTTAKIADANVTDAKIVSVAGSKVTGTIPVAGVPVGSGNYIQNTTTPQPSSNFNISGNGTAGGTLSGGIVSATTQYTLNGSRILHAPGSNNIFAGFSAGAANTTGTNNSFFGQAAGFVNSTGGSNSIFGSEAGGANTSGSGNSFFGRFAGGLNTTGSNNSFFGSSAGFNNTVGTNNSFFGVAAGSASINNNNSFFGFSAGTSNTAGSANAFFGNRAGFSNTTANDNSFFGSEAGLNNLTGTNNAFFGSEAGKANTTGSGNTFIGRGAGLMNTTGTKNDFFGSFAGSLTTTGSFNSFFGNDSGKSNTTGGQNSFFGWLAGEDNTIASGNAFFGVSAGGNTTTGGSNTFIGGSAGFTNTIGAENTIIGSLANVMQSGLTNATAIGFRSVVNCSNCLILGSVNGENGATSNVKVGIGTPNPVELLHVGGDLRIGDGGNPTNGCIRRADATIILGSCSSDLRFKRDISPFLNVLPKLTRLQPVHFYWRAAEFPAKHFGNTQSYGLIAQEVEEVMPELVTEDEQGYKKVNYSKLPLLTIQAIKELKAENDTLKAQNTRLLEQSEALKKQNAAIEARLAALEKLLQAGSKQQ